MTGLVTSALGNVGIFLGETIFLRHILTLHPHFHSDLKSKTFSGQKKYSSLYVSHLESFAASFTHSLFSDTFNKALKLYILEAWLCVKVFEKIYTGDIKDVGLAQSIS